jgi:tetratricopeptide (TPR) repeat protein
MPASQHPRILRAADKRPETSVQMALRYLNQGDARRALALADAAPRQLWSSETTCRAFALICLSAGKCQKARRWFDRALLLNPNCPDLLSGRAMALQGMNRLAEAISDYDQALAIRPIDPESHYNRGVACQSLGELTAALRSYDEALAQRPDYVEPMAARCAVLEILGRLDEALACSRLLVVRTPNSAGSWCQLANVLQGLGDHQGAIPAYSRALALQPGHPAALLNRGLALHETGESISALQDLEDVLGLEPKNTGALITRGNVLQALGRLDDAEADYRHAVALKPLILRPARKFSPDFRVLFVFAPMGGNTPYDDLISQAGFESNLLMLLPGMRYDLKELRGKSDVVVNLVSDVDRSREALEHCAALTSALAKPLINPPARVLMTDRDSISRLLEPAEFCCVPSTRKYSRDDLYDRIQNRSSDIVFPVIIRVAGTHGGDDMQRVDGWPALTGFVSSVVGSQFYVTDYVDYWSADGFFRKYRFMFVGDRILPYHLAIGSDWKVHHASTDMVNHPWMQHEEQKFLDEPELTFGQNAYRALAAIRDRIGLDYFGVDCALCQDGRVVVFEANASMLVHSRNGLFPYKNAAVLRIITAFHAMLESKSQTFAGGA